MSVNNYHLSCFNERRAELDLLAVTITHPDFLEYLDDVKECELDHHNETRIQQDLPVWDIMDSYPAGPVAASPSSGFFDLLLGIEGVLPPLPLEAVVEEQSGLSLRLSAAAKQLELRGEIPGWRWQQPQKV